MRVGSRIVLEQMFDVPGAGRPVSHHILRRDYPLVEGLVILTTTIRVCTNLAVDILFRYLDPRVRLA